MAGLPSLFENFMSPCQSRESFTMSVPLARLGAFAMLHDRGVRQDARELFNRRSSLSQPRVRVLGHADGGSLRALAQLFERGLAHDEHVVVFVGHPQIGDERPAAIAGAVTPGAAGAFEQLDVRLRAT